MLKGILAALALAATLALIVPGLMPEAWGGATLEAACPPGYHDTRVKRCKGWLWWRECWWESVCQWTPPPPKDNPPDHCAITPWHWDC